MTSLRATAAPMSPAPSMLCPQPCPLVLPSLRGSLRGTASFPRPGRASYSGNRPKVGPPEPHSATNAVGTPAVPSLFTTNPFSPRASIRSRADSTSSWESSASSHTSRTIFSITGPASSTLRSTDPMGVSCLATQRSFGFGLLSGLPQGLPGGLGERQGGDDADEAGGDDVEGGRDGVAGGRQEGGKDEGGRPAEDGDRHAVAQRERAVADARGEDLAHGGRVDPRADPHHAAAAPGRGRGGGRR